MKIKLSAASRKMFPLMKSVVGLVAIEAVAVDGEDIVETGTVSYGMRQMMTMLVEKLLHLMQLLVGISIFLGLKQSMNTTTFLMGRWIGGGRVRSSSLSMIMSKIER